MPICELMFKYTNLNEEICHINNIYNIFQIYFYCCYMQAFHEIETSFVHQMCRLNIRVAGT